MALLVFARPIPRACRHVERSTVGPELLLVSFVVAALGALSASRQPRDLLATWRRGQLAFAAAQYEEAEACFRATLALAEQRFGPDHWRTALHCNALAQALLAQKRLDDAAPHVDRAMGILERWSPLPHTELATVMAGAAAFESARGRHARAVSLLERARRSAKGDAVVRAGIERTLAQLEGGIGHEAEAADALARIPFERLEARDARALAGFGIARLRDGDAERAVRCLTAAHGLVERESAGEFAEAFYLGLLGEALARAGRDEDARRALEQAVIDYDAIVGEAHPATAVLLVELAEVRLRLGDAAGARAACERVLGMRVSVADCVADPYRVSAVSGDPLERERDRARALLARARTHA
jgi:tetratricopeptide (TPR) repeat protein